MEKEAISQKDAALKLQMHSSPQTCHQDLYMFTLSNGKVKFSSVDMKCGIWSGDKLLVDESKTEQDLQEPNFTCAGVKSANFYVWHLLTY